MPRRERNQTETGADTGGTITIEADTVEEAMERLATEVGNNAEIVEARKVLRGGIGGFFAKERVQLTVRAEQSAEAAAGLAGVLDRMTRDAEAQEVEFATMLRQEMGNQTKDLGLDTFLEAVGWDERTSVSAAEKAHAAIDDVTAGLNADSVPAPATQPEVEDVAAAKEDTSEPDPIPVQHSTPLRVPPGEGPAKTDQEIFTQAARAGVIRYDTQAAPALPVAKTPTAPIEVGGSDSSRATSLIADGSGTPPGMGPVKWSKVALVRNGIPTEIVAAVAELDPFDDLGWITGIAKAVAPYCTINDDIDVVMIGEEAVALAGRLDIPVVAPGETAPYDGSFAANITSSDDREWLEFVKGRRRIHCIIGPDQSWRQNLIDIPAVVSWSDQDSLVDALYLAVASEAALGYGVLGEATEPAKVFPIDVALAIRSMMDRS